MPQQSRSHRRDNLVGLQEPALTRLQAAKSSGAEQQDDLAALLFECVGLDLHPALDLGTRELHRAAVKQPRYQDRPARLDAIECLYIGLRKSIQQSAVDAADRLGDIAIDIGTISRRGAWPIVRVPSR